jgi:hypothetical protein
MNREIIENTESMFINSSKNVVDKAEKTKTYCNNYFNYDRYVANSILNDLSSWLCESNSVSISYDLIRRDYVQWENKTNAEIRSMLEEDKKGGLSSFVLELDDFGVDCTFIHENDEEKFEDGSYSGKDGLCIYIADNLFYSNYDDFYRGESGYYNSDDEFDNLVNIKPYFDKIENLHQLSKNELLEIIKKTTDAEDDFHNMKIDYIYTLIYSLEKEEYKGYIKDELTFINPTTRERLVAYSSESSADEVYSTCQLLQKENFLDEIIVLISDK